MNKPFAPVLCVAVDGGLGAHTRLAIPVHGVTTVTVDTMETLGVAWVQFGDENVEATAPANGETRENATRVAKDTVQIFALPAGMTHLSVLPAGDDVTGSVVVTFGNGE